MEPKKLNVGIIGAGSISKRHLTHYSQNPNVNLIAISDLNEALAKERAEEYGLRYYRDIRFSEEAENLNKWLKENKIELAKWE